MLLYSCISSIRIEHAFLLTAIFSMVQGQLTQVIDETTESVTASSHEDTQRPLRLPNSTFPLHYRLHISSNIHLEAFDYKGNVTIDIVVRESTNEIVLHSKNLTITSIRAHEIKSGELFDDLTYSYDLHGDFLIIHPVEKYQAFEQGQQLRVEILYTGIMNPKTFGIYWLTYNDVNNRTVYLAATQFEPTSARLAFPCYDEPGFKANFTISITHGSNYHAISNMDVQNLRLLDSEESNGNNLTTTTFQTTPPISTYLVAFVISDFEHISAEYRGVTQRIFTSPDTVDKGEKVLKNVVKIVATLEDYFGVNYPLSKLDHIALTKNYGAAMENWGLITYKQDNLVLPPNADVHKQLKDIITQSHEISHQWFGNLVSPQWWTYIWLNEGFATYFSYIITDMIFPEYKVMDFFITDTAERAYSYNYINARPMTYYVETESDIISIFDLITYHRAACVIKMFHHALDQKTFVRGISNYLRKFQYSSVNELDLFASIQTAVEEDNHMGVQRNWVKDIPDMMMSWTHSEWIPIVTIIYNRNNDTITIRQKSKDTNTLEHRWIPINFASASQPDFEHTRADYFMPPVSEVTISVQDIVGFRVQPQDWLIINKQQTGFYHVLYDDVNLLNIARVLQQNHSLIHTLNRAAIFQDLCPLIENNEIGSVHIIFELLRYLEHEEELILWNFVADIAEFFDNTLFGTASHAFYKQFMRHLITPIFRRQFANGSESDTTDMEISARQKIMKLACQVDLQDCLQYTHKLAHDYIFRNSQFHGDNGYFGVTESILCWGLKYLTDDEFNAIMELLTKSDPNILLNENIIYSLHCTQRRSQQKQYLNLLFSPNSTRAFLKEHDALLYLFFLFKSNMGARPVVWQYLEHNYRKFCHSPMFVENFNRIAEYISPEQFVNYIKLRESIAVELQTNGINVEDVLIDAQSSRIGKKMRMTETFLSKFGRQIYEWLQRDHLSRTTQTAAIFGAHNNGLRTSPTIFQFVSSLYKKMLKVKL